MPFDAQERQQATIKAAKLMGSAQWVALALVGGYGPTLATAALTTLIAEATALRDRIVQDTND